MPSAADPPTRQRFLVHCVVAACNSGLDILLKSGVIVFAAFHGDVDARTLSLIAALAWGLFMAPFFLLSAHGGYMGDRFDNRRLALLLKGADLLIALGAAVGFLAGNLAILLVMVFAKGCTAALFSPIKFSLIVRLLPSASRRGGYALLEAVSMLAILLATYLGAILGAEPLAWRIALAAVVIAAGSLVVSVFYPPLPGLSPKAPRPGFDPLRPTVRILMTAFSDRRAFSAILALSWFWALGAVFLANVPTLVRDTFDGGETQVAVLLVTFTLGMSVGLSLAALVGRAGGGSRLGLMMAVFIAVCGMGLIYPPSQALGRTLLLFMAIATALGVYAGHYSSILFSAASDDERARLFAANNVVSSLVMLLALGVSAAMIGLNVSLEVCLAIFAAASAPITALCETARKM